MTTPEAALNRYVVECAGVAAVQASASAALAKNSLYMNPPPLSDSDALMLRLLLLLEQSSAALLEAIRTRFGDELDRTDDNQVSCS